MKVSTVMTRVVEFVPSDGTLQEAATVMAEHDVGAVLVGSPERLEGILTERDIILRAVTQGLDPGATRTEQVMSRTVFTCGPDDPAEQVLAAMAERQVRRLPVVEEGVVVGIVVRSDLERCVEAAKDDAGPRH